MGTVQEGRFTHQIMVPFFIKGEVEVTWIQEGSFTVDTVVAHITDNRGKEHNLTGPEMAGPSVYRQHPDQEWRQDPAEIPE